MFRRSDIIYFGEGPKKPRVTFAQHEQDAKKKFQDPAAREEYLRRSKEMMQSTDEFQKKKFLRSTIEEDAKKIQDEDARAGFRKQAEEILKGRELYKTTKDIQSAVEQAEEIKRLQKENIEDAYLKAHDVSKRLQEGSMIKTKAIIENPNRSEEFARLQKENIENPNRAEEIKKLQKEYSEESDPKIKELLNKNIQKEYSDYLKDIDDFWGPDWEGEFSEPEIPQQKLSKEEFIQKAFPPIDINKKKQQMEDAEIWEKQYKPMLRPEGILESKEPLGFLSSHKIPGLKDPNPKFPRSKEREIYEQKQIAEQIPGLEKISTENITLNQPKKSSILSKLKNISLFKKNQTPYATTYKFEEGVDIPINEDINMSTISRKDFLNKMANETPFETEINAPLTPEHKKNKQKLILSQIPGIEEISESIGSDEVFQTPTEGLSRQSSIAPKGRYKWPEGVSRQTSEAPSRAATTASEKYFRDKYPDGPPDPIQLGMDINDYYSRRDQPENIYARKKAKALISSPSRYNKINIKEKIPETTYEATTRHQGALEAKKRTLPPSNFESNDMKRKKELKLQEEQKKYEEQLEKDTDERIDTEIKLIQNKDKIVTRNREELLDLLENNSDFKERGEILNMIKELPPPRSSKGYMRSLDKNNKILNEEDKIKNTTKQRLLDLYKKTKYDKERLDILSIIKNYN